VLGKLNPFKGLPNPKEVWAWGMYDFANQSFTLLIITLLFSLYVKEVVTPHPIASPELAQYLSDLGTDPGVAPPSGLESELAAYRDADARADREGSAIWSWIHGGSLLLVVLASPIVGALADVKGWRKQFLIGTGFFCCVLTCALVFAKPGLIWLAAILYVPANLCYQIGENFLASFLPRVSTQRNIGRVSAIGWTMGYVGALCLLVLSFAGMVLLGLSEPQDWGLFFVFAGLWFLLGMTPSVFMLHDDAPSRRPTEENIFAQSFGRVADTLRHAGNYRQLVKFLIAFFVYAFGVQVIIGFASIIAADFGFEKQQLILFVAQITVTAGIASAATTAFQDRIGAKWTVMLYLVIWIASSGGLVLIKLVWPDGGPQWPLWLVGNGLGFALGGIGTASRSMIGRFTPKHRTAEFFGLWGMTYKLAGAIGVLSFGTVAGYFGQLASLWLLLGFFVVGFILVLPVSEVAGVRAARRTERDFERARVAAAAD